MKTRTKDKIMRLAALALSLGAATCAWATDVWMYWDKGGGENTELKTAANWGSDNTSYVDTVPAADDNWEFGWAGNGASVTFADYYTDVGNVYFRNAWNTGAPSAYILSSTATGTIGGFQAKCINIGDWPEAHGAVRFVSGKYVATGWSNWAWATGQASADVTVEGANITLAGLNMMFGNQYDPYVMGQNTNIVTVLSGSIVSTDDVYFGSNSSGSKGELTIGDADGDGSATAVFQVGTEEYEKAFYFCDWWCHDGTTVDINLNKGGFLKVYKLAWPSKRNPDANHTVKLNLNGGTLESLGSTTDMFIVSGIAMTVGTNGGTIDVGANNVTIAANVTGSGIIMKKGSGTLEFTGDMSGFTGQIIVAEGGAVTVPSTSAATAGVGTALSGLVFSNNCYVWTGASDSNWANKDNWTFAGGAANDYPNNSSAVVCFPNDATVSISDADKYVDDIVISGNATVTLSVVNKWMYIDGDVIGNGTLSLNNVTGIYFNKGDQTVYANVNVVENTSAKFIANMNTSNNTLWGTLLGKGSLTLSISGSRKNYGGFNISGDTSSFEGQIDIDRNGNQRPTFYINSESALNNSKSSWYLGFNDFTGGGSGGLTDYFQPFRIPNKTYQFGALNGRIPYVPIGNKGDGWLTGIRIKVGALNTPCDLVGDWPGVTNSGLEWDALSETITYGVKNNAFIDVTGGGTLNLNNTGIMRTGGTITFSGEGSTLKIASTADYDPSAFLATSATVPLIFDDEGNNRTWNTALTTSISGLTKQGAGTLTLAQSPTYTGKTTVEAGTLSIPTGTTLGELSIAEGAYLYVDGSNDETITVTSFTEGDTTKGRVKTIAGGSVNFVYDETTGKYTGTIVRTPLTYTWNGMGDKTWESLDNWTVTATASGEAATAVSVPTTEDTVVFPDSGAPWAVTLENDQTVGTVTFNGATTLSGALLCPNAVSGNAAITLGDGAGFSVAANMTIANNIVIAAGNSSPALITNTASGLGCTLSGALSGTGYLKLTGTSHHHHLYGNNGNFYGYVIVENFGTTGLMNRSKNGTDHTSASSANAHWTVNYSGNNFLDCDANGVNPTFKFGTLTGSISESNASGHYPLTYEVGALCGEGETMELTYYGINKSNADRQNYFRMVGSGTFAITGERIRGFYLNNGTTYFKSNGCIPSLGIYFNDGTLKLDSAVTSDPSEKFVFADGKTAIVDDGGVTRKFATAIGNSTSANFVKKGAGALTLSAEPTYTGTTKVEEGTLYIVDTYKPTLAAGTAQVESDKDGYKKFVVGTVSGDADLTVVATTEKEAAAMATVTPAEGVDATCYKVVATETSAGTGVYTLKVTFADEVMKVARETVSGGQVTFAMANFKEGLYYGVATGDSADGVTTTGVTLEKCEDASQGVSLTAGLPSSGVKYYKIVVSDTASAQ